MLTAIAARNDRISGFFVFFSLILVCNTIERSMLSFPWLEMLM